MDLQSREMERTQSRPIEDSQALAHTSGKPDEEMDRVPEKSFQNPNSLEAVRREKDALVRMLVSQREESEAMAAQNEELKAKVQELTERCDRQEARLECQEMEILHMDSLLDKLHGLFMKYKMMSKGLSLTIQDVAEENEMLEKLLHWRDSECEEMSCLLLEQNEDLVELEREIQVWRLAGQAWHREKLHLIGHIAWQKQEIAEKDGLIQDQQREIQRTSTKCQRQISKLRDLREELLCHSKECQTLNDLLLKQSDALCAGTKQNEELRTKVKLLEETTDRLQNLALEE